MTPNVMDPLLIIDSISCEEMWYTLGQVIRYFNKCKHQNYFLKLSLSMNYAMEEISHDICICVDHLRLLFCAFHYMKEPVELNLFHFLDWQKLNSNIQIYQGVNFRFHVVIKPEW